MVSLKVTKKNFHKKACFFCRYISKTGAAPFRAVCLARWEGGFVFVVAHLHPPPKIPQIFSPSIASTSHLSWGWPIVVLVHRALWRCCRRWCRCRCRLGILSPLVPVWIWLLWPSIRVGRGGGRVECRLSRWMGRVQLLSGVVGRCRAVVVTHL